MKKKLKIFNVYIDVQEIYSVKARTIQEAERKCYADLIKNNVIWTPDEVLINAEEYEE